MNYFAHAIKFLDQPYFAVGTGIPDWLTVCDRSVRLRSKRVEAFISGADNPAAEVAGGVLRHIRDDAFFHQSRAFAELSLALTVEFRDALGADSGFRPSFLGHMLVEVLLDASLMADDPDLIEAYHRTIDRVDPEAVQRAVNLMAPRQTDRLAWLISAFCRERVLSDYLEDGKLMERIGQVMRRVKLPQ